MIEYRVLALTLAARPNGVHSSEIGHPNNSRALDILTRMVKGGLLFKGKLGVRTLRFFTTEKAAQRWHDANIVAHQARVASHGVTIKRVKFDHDAPMVFTDKTVFTYAPPPPASVPHTCTYPVW